jgi:hypothetical protein
MPAHSEKEDDVAKIEINWDTLEGNIDGVPLNLGSGNIPYFEKEDDVAKYKFRPSDDYVAKEPKSNYEKAQEVLRDHEHRSKVAAKLEALCDRHDAALARAENKAIAIKTGVTVKQANYDAARGIVKASENFQAEHDRLKLEVETAEKEAEFTKLRAEIEDRCKSNYAQPEDAHEGDRTQPANAYEVAQEILREARINGNEAATELYRTLARVSRPNHEQQADADFAAALEREALAEEKRKAVAKTERDAVLAAMQKGFMEQEQSEDRVHRVGSAPEIFDHADALEREAKSDVVPTSASASRYEEPGKRINDDLQAERSEPKRVMDLSFVIQDFDWEKDTAPKLEIYFCQSSGLTSVKLTVAEGQEQEDSVQLSEGHSRFCIKGILEGYIEIFQRGLESLGNAPSE